MRRQKQIGILAAIVGAILIACSQAYLSSSAPATPVAVSFGNLPQSKQPVTILKNRGYTVGYSEAMRDPLWVCYTLKQADSNDERLRRPAGGFEMDPRTTAQITSHDYTRSGYDRGHMAPSYAIGKFHGREAQKETFTMSNVVPQSHFCNDGVWNSIERMESDDFAKRFNQVEVVDGPVFDGNPARFPSGVAVPSAFYKSHSTPGWGDDCFYRAPIS
ncbi:MAG: DNA/RNA non-specific endonuclease [Chthoniobacterales bacterium]